MADTITILDGLAHAQNTADSATLFDIDDAVNSAVGTWPVAIPMSATRARVIFNNTFDPDGATVACRVRVTKATDITTAASVATATKTENTQAMEWTDLAQNTVVETGTIDLDSNIQSVLHIDVCLSNTTAHTGTEIVVQIASEAGVDDAWTTLGAGGWIGPTGTAISAVLPANEAAGQTEISLTNPVANNFDNDGKFKFMKNGTIANSEIVYQTAQSGDT
ncbi:hypothetical protein LCGC14_0376770 [marine sediment metagenome]|uniref:Uncharacterized protein n=1 Tax=marine sediment metagenome TaxID=412755 RepID=A0A0F9VQS1_9ZZZZ